MLLLLRTRLIVIVIFFPFLAGPVSTSSSRDLEEKNAVVAKDISFLQSVFEQEKVQRAERDMQIQKR